MSIDDFDDLDWAQVARYLGGELPEAEARALERWFERDEAHRRVLAETRAAWEATASPRAEWDAETALQRLRNAVAHAAGEPDSLRRLRPPRVRVLARPEHRFLPAAIAASLALVGLSGALVWRLWHAAPPVNAPPVPPVMTEVATRRAERAEVRLTDGSRVVLGVASRLRYPRDFGVGSRTVELEGEAYFDVVHDEARPFRVRAGPGELEDVGTAFVVRSYGGRSVLVVVAKGAVMVRRPAASTDGVLLTAAQLARLDDAGIVRRDGVRVDRYLAWTRGELVFTDAPLVDVAAELSRWFDVEVSVGDSAIGARRFTGSFGREAVTSVVRALAAATDVDVDRADGGWRFRSKAPGS